MSDAYSTAEKAPIEPACWNWPEPTEADRTANEAGLRELLARAALTPDQEGIGESLLIDWHAGRCAICGLDWIRLVIDHDHQTGLQRGLLCRSCNTAEGMNRHSAIYRKYRERNPASILRVSARYWEPFAGEFAQPAPLTPDKWQNNPMRGIGL